jgi:hypothetical protein
VSAVASVAAESMAASAAVTVFAAVVPVAAVAGYPARLAFFPPLRCITSRLILLLLIDKLFWVSYSVLS